MQVLLEAVRMRTASVLMVSDSPDFCKKGDNPELEGLLSASLVPRGLKGLPDLALLVLIDTSGSIFGVKL